MSTNSSVELPPAIAAYQSAHDARDVETALAQFSPDAVVVDDGREYRGTEGVEEFIRGAAAEFTFTRTLLDAVEEGPGQWLVTNHLAGDFPGGVVDLTYRFRLVDDRIVALVIAP